MIGTSYSNSLFGFGLLRLCLFTFEFASQTPVTIGFLLQKSVVTICRNSEFYIFIESSIVSFYGRSARLSGGCQRFL